MMVVCQLNRKRKHVLFSRHVPFMPLLFSQFKERRRAVDLDLYRKGFRVFVYDQVSTGSLTVFGNRTDCYCLKKVETFFGIITRKAKLKDMDQHKFVPVLKKSRFVFLVKCLAEEKLVVQTVCSIFLSRLHSAIVILCCSLFQLSSYKRHGSVSRDCQIILWVLPKALRVTGRYKVSADICLEAEP